MKTSNKLLVVAFVLLLVSLFLYDNLLKAEYLTGKYKDPYKSYINLNFKDFDTVNVVSSTAINVKFVQGPFGVTIDPDASGYARVTREGRTLKIAASYVRAYRNARNTYVMVISCPKLSAVYADATYIAGDKPITDTVNREDWNMRGLLVEGFKEESLLIRQNYGSGVTLSNNNIGTLNAVIGINPGSGSKFDVLKTNAIANAGIEINNRSTLLLKSADIKNLSYRLADSAKMIVSAAAQNLFNNSSSTPKK